MIHCESGVTACCRLIRRLVLLSLLSVVGIRSVLAVVVLLYEQRVHGELWVDREGHECHLGTLFHNLCVIDSIVGRCAP